LDKSALSNILQRLLVLCNWKINDDFKQNKEYLFTTYDITDEPKVKYMSFIDYIVGKRELDEVQENIHKNGFSKGNVTRLQIAIHKLKDAWYNTYNKSTQPLWLDLMTDLIRANMELLKFEWNENITADIQQWWNEIEPQLNINRDQKIIFPFVEATLLLFHDKIDCQKLLSDKTQIILESRACLSFIQLWDVNPESFENFWMMTIRFICICVCLQPNSAILNYLKECMVCSQNNFQKLQNEISLDPNTIRRNVDISENAFRPFFDHDTDTKRSLENCFNKLLSLSNLARDKHVRHPFWEWHIGGRWKIYLPLSINHEIEAAYQSKPNEIFHLKWQPGMHKTFASKGYNLDFDKKVQINNESSYPRKIQRVEKFDPKRFHLTCCLFWTFRYLELLCSKGKRDFEDLKNNFTQKGVGNF